MDATNVLELVIWAGLVMTRTASRILEAALEWIFVACTWVALLIVGAVMACQRGGLPWSDPTDARATSRSTGSIGRRVSLR